mmetsp:Transcript_62250/g.135205  ORF Transcript_62250/g.135205 Transcript_62250/m.135205 type:complete len:111 (-) Transcript_62250:165-497(-)
MTSFQFTEFLDDLLSSCRALKSKGNERVDQCHNRNNTPTGFGDLQEKLVDGSLANFIKVFVFKQSVTVWNISEVEHGALRICLTPLCVSQRQHLAKLECGKLTAVIFNSA